MNIYFIHEKAFEAEGIADDVDIFLATISPPKGDAVDYTNLLAPALSDPGVVKYLSGIGLQYAGIGLFDAIKKANPTLKTWETETPCGNGRARDCGTGPGTRNNSWAWGESQWSTMRSFLEAGASVYSQWNMVRCHPCLSFFLLALLLFGVSFFPLLLRRHRYSMLCACACRLHAEEAVYTSLALKFE